VAGRNPASVVSLARETHVSDEVAEAHTAIQILIAFHDGLGRDIETKQLSDPGQALSRSPDGALLRSAAGVPTLETVIRRWRVSGRSIFNNKGVPVKVYLPYFSNLPRYERQRDVTDAGLLPPPTVVHYDAVGRATRIDTPKGFFSSVVYRAWSRWQYDEADTVKQSAYYKANIDNRNTPPAERDALRKAAVFANTPQVLLLDPNGDAVRRVQILVESDNGTPTPIPDDAPHPERRQEGRRDRRPAPDGDEPAGRQRAIPPRHGWRGAAGSGGRLRCARASRRHQWQ
jgi:hypothetical protein